MKKFLLLFVGLAVVATLAGCTTSKPVPPNGEQTAQFVALDKGVQDAISCPGVQISKTVDGRMKVTAHLQNRVNRRIEVQANCEFKDAQGYTVDPTPFRTVILDENATEDVSFEALNTNAVKYTIRVREAR